MSPRVNRTKKHHRLKANLHLHTYHSDGIFTPGMIFSYAKKHGVTVLSITDHNMIAGSVRGMKIARKYGITFFPGIECAFSVKDKYFEVLAYFEEVADLGNFFEVFMEGDSFIPKFKSVKALTDLIETHKGVAIAPHPFGRKGVFRHKRNGKRVIFGGAGYEQINAFTGKIRNKRAKKYLNHENCIVLGAGDMHFIRAAIDTCFTELVSEKEITRDKIWHNLSGKAGDIDFIPRGKCFPPHVIWAQKFLCALRLDLARHYLFFLGRKIKKRFKATKPLVHD